MIEDTQLAVQIIKHPTKDRVRFDIFDRVNRGGTPLNKQEMRNALYQGNATKLLNRLHMKDKYIILRALCFYLLYQGEIVNSNNEKIEYRSDMEEFLGTGMQLFNSMSEERLHALEKLFDQTMKRAYECMGEDGFRIPSKGKSRRPISMTLFETLFYYYTLFEKNFDINMMRQGIKELLRDAEYLESLQYTVDSSFRVAKRFQKVIDKYKEIIDVRKNKSAGV